MRPVFLFRTHIRSREAKRPEAVIEQPARCESRLKCKSSIRPIPKNPGYRSSKSAGPTTGALLDLDPQDRS